MSQGELRMSQRVEAICSIMPAARKHFIFFSTVLQVADASHLEDGVVLPGMFGVVPLQKTPPRGAARPGKL